MLLSRLNRPPQRQAPFVVGEPESGYYNDLRVELGTDDPADARRRLQALVVDRERANHITVAQLALGAWQMRGEDDAWLQVFAEGAAWLAEALEEGGGLPYLFAMPHTYSIRPPWYSAMAQGQAASVFVRAALSLGEDRFIEAAERATLPLTIEDSTIVAHTPEGPVLQEYPTQPPSHVLNGWMFALWGLYDVGMLADRARRRCRALRPGPSSELPCLRREERPGLSAARVPRCRGESRGTRATSSNRAASCLRPTRDARRGTRRTPSSRRGSSRPGRHTSSRRRTGLPGHG